MFSGLFSLPFAPAESATVALREPSATAPESFLAGSENALVRTLATAVMDRQLSYNPIVLHGSAGTGKSSLAGALIARRQRAFDLTETITTTGVDLARALAHAVETASVADLRARHHRCDILLVDDLHRLAGKAAAQQFLLAALDALVHRGSLVILTLRQSPLSTRGLIPQLASRLAGGLVVGLALPGPLARRELVRQTADRLHLALTPSDLNDLAGCGADARESFLTANRLRQSVLRLAAARELGHSAKSTKPPPRDRSHAKLICRQAAAAVAKHFGLTLGDLKGKSRRQAIADARGLAMYVSRQLTGASYAEIGRQFGGRDHTTVLHACQKLASLIQSDAAVRQLSQELAAQLAAEEAIES